jgi:hypothetical protein
MKLEPDTVVWADRPATGGAGVVYKMYRNRGRFNWLRESAGRFRVEREYNALEFLVQHGLPCSRPRYWTCGILPDHGHYEILCMDELPRVVALKEEFPAAGAGDCLKGADYHALSGLIRRMHAAGFFHGRLDLRNILVGADAAGRAAYYIIDTPQAMTFPYDIGGTRMGWADLRHFATAIRRHAGAEACEVVLTHYGLDAKAKARMLHAVAAGGRPLLGRECLRFEFGLRARLARLV